MEVTGTRFTAHNIQGSFERNENIQEYFQLEAPPNTKIWRKPITHDNMSAPMILTSLQQPFLLAEVTVSVDLDVEWDQAGLVIFAGTSPTTTTAPSLHRRRNPSPLGGQPEQAGGKWVKASLELAAGEPGLSTVVANPSCGPDWSFTPTCPCDEGQLPSLRVKLEKVDDDLWVWYRIAESSAIASEYRSPGEVSMDWKKAREVSGFFTDVDAKLGVTVGCYTSRPMPLEEDEKNTLFAEFEDLEIL